VKIPSPINNGKQAHRETDTQIDIETEGQMNSRSLLSVSGLTY